MEVKPTSRLKESSGCIWCRRNETSISPDNIIKRRWIWHEPLLNSPSGDRRQSRPLETPGQYYLWKIQMNWRQCGNQEDHAWIAKLDYELHNYTIEDRITERSLIDEEAQLKAKSPGIPSLTKRVGSRVNVIFLSVKNTVNVVYQLFFFFWVRKF